MKTIKITLIVMSLLLVSCANRKTIELTNGKKISQRKLHRMIAKSVKQGLKDLSSEERDLLLNSKIDTVNYINNK